ncbi:DedA family protein [Streptomyces phaeochromogenes]|uniref:DedA family protein n=1 Tax=Streptomyces phaeochromogenes TaxID=1923 RepID=A0ABZ1H446_STRPH|nr:DedA family protein [Streptomyces phaeochromogenes]MCX5602413.1 DedA family protein [Streptomyces phaeochromogenes]WRZ26812.1 DedA family protein [Streptomyces phaeochromogenes]WSD12377.1 DedA family protein [Streptomyces phaeochromogenes]WSJ10822.1 DedA family protein [Streptomyces phaeochromogenes]
MPDWINLAESLIASPALYAVLIAVSLLDSFLPLIPSEPVVIIAGVAGATGQTNIMLVIASTAAGAFLGDLVPYSIGRLMGERALKRLPVGTKRRKAYDWFERELESRGGFVLVSTRFIPVGRYLATGTAGVVRYPLRRFMLYVAISTSTWSAYTALSGYLGGVFFQENTLLSIAVGVGFALAVTGAVEFSRYVRRRNNPAEFVRKH